MCMRLLLLCLLAVHCSSLSHLPLPEHVKVVHHIVCRRVIARVHNQRPPRQIDLRDARHELTARLLEEAELVDLGLEAAPTALLPSTHIQWQWQLACFCEGSGP